MVGRPYPRASGVERHRDIEAEYCISSTQVRRRHDFPPGDIPPDFRGQEARLEAGNDASTMFTQTEKGKGGVETMERNSVYIRGAERQLAESCIGKTCHSFIRLSTPRARTWTGTLRMRQELNGPWESKRWGRRNS